MNTQLNTLKYILTQQLESHQTGGNIWPDDAVFSVVYNLSTWPVGWDRRSNVKFFTSRGDFDNWLNELHEWEKKENNHFAFQAYTWDLGPIQTLENQNTGNLTMTWSEWDQWLLTGK